jgi:hypothetical protein
VREVRSLEPFGRDRGFRIRVVRETGLLGSALGRLDAAGGQRWNRPRALSRRNGMGRVTLVVLTALLGGRHPGPMRAGRRRLGVIRVGVHRILPFRGQPGHPLVAGGPTRPTP